MIVMKRCLQCKSFYESDNPNRKYCSDKCRKKYNRDRYGTFIYICAGCGNEFRAYRKRKYCKKECGGEKYLHQHLTIEKRVEYNRQCKECGKSFTTTNKAQYFCTHPCNRAYGYRVKDVNRRKKIKENGRVDHSISVERLIKRDGENCYICGGKTNKKLNYTESDYPSIDHVIPIAKGGTHTWDNVKLAHRKCNIKKSDEV